MIPRIRLNNRLHPIHLKLLLCQFSFVNSWDGPSDKLSVEATCCLMVHTISIVLDGDGLVLLLDSHLLNAILFHEFKQRSISEHLGNFELMLIPVFQEAALHIARVHIKYLPVDLGACFTDKSAKGHIEMCGLRLSTVDAIGIKGILDEKALDQFALLGNRALDMRFGRRLRDEV